MHISATWSERTRGPDQPATTGRLGNSHWRWEQGEKHGKNGGWMGKSSNPPSIGSIHLKILYYKWWIFQPTIFDCKEVRKMEKRSPFYLWSSHLSSSLAPREVRQISLYMRSCCLLIQKHVEILWKCQVQTKVLARVASDKCKSMYIIYKWAMFHSYVKLPETTCFFIGHYPLECAVECCWLNRQLLRTPPSFVNSIHIMLLSN